MSDGWGQQPLPPPPPPAPPGWGGPGPQQSPYQQQPGFGPGYAPYVVSPPSSGKATASLVLGILSIAVCGLGPIFGGIAVFLGVSAKREAAGMGQPQPGTAQAGFITGIIGCILGGLLWAFYAVIIIGAIASDSNSYDYDSFIRLLLG